MSDGLTARKENPWILETVDCVDRTQVKTFATGRKINAKDSDGVEILDDAGQPIKIDEEILIVQRAPIWTLVRKRTGIGIEKINPQNGEIKKTFMDLHTGPETRLSMSSIGRIGTGKRFICVHDKPTITNPITGAFEQRQVWVYQGPWENMNPNLFGGYRVSTGGESTPGGGNDPGEGGGNL